MTTRRVEKVVAAQPTSDGAGVKLRRTIGTPELDHLDPFLLLDEFRSDSVADYGAGFPDHPHRGFETVTYMLAGTMEHRDDSGNHGLLTAGSVQWMTAGRGIIHSEMPRQVDGLMWGFQLWVNLPAKDKMMPPRYQDIPPGAIPERTAAGGARVRVVAGEAEGVSGPVKGIATSPLYLDVTVPAGGRFDQPVPAGMTAACYVFEGTAAIGGEGAPTVPTGSLAILGDGDTVTVSAPSGAARFLLLAARPLREPIARYGPFVMTTRDEVAQAFRDYQSGTLTRYDVQ